MKLALSRVSHLFGPFPLSAFIGIVLVARITRSYWDWAGIVFLTFFFFHWSKKKAKGISAQKCNEIQIQEWFARIVLFFTALVFIHHRILKYHEQYYAFFCSLVVLAVVCAALFFNDFYRAKPREPSPRFLYVLLLILFVAHILIPLVSPKPFSDVFYSNSLAADFFLQGKNPYGQTYVNIYGRDIGYPPGFVYWPTLLYWISASKWIFGDIRYTLILADFGTIFLIFKIFRFKGFNQLSSLLACCVWATYPLALRTLESSWVDTLLMFFCALSYWFLLNKRWVLLGIAIGLLTLVKQYGFFVPLMLAAVLLFKGQIRQLCIVTSVALITAAAVAAPVVLPEWEGFHRMTVEVPVTQPIRKRSLSLASFYLRVSGGPPSWWAYSLAYISAVVFGAGWVYRFREKSASYLLSVSLVWVYGVVFLFSKQVWPNYWHYWLIFFWISIADEFKPSVSDSA